MSPLSTLKTWGSSSILVFLMKLPIGVTLGSFLVVHAFFSAPASCIFIERNLYMLNSLLCRPTLTCLKMRGPGEVSLTSMLTISIGIPNTISMHTAPNISTTLLINLLNELLRGTFLILITGRPSISSVCAVVGITLL